MNPLTNNTTRTAAPSHPSLSLFTLFIYPAQPVSKQQLFTAIYGFFNTSKTAEKAFGISSVYQYTSSTSFKVCRAPFKVYRVPFRACRVPFRVCRAPFKACRVPFKACRVPFRVCRAPFKACRVPFRVCRAPFGEEGGAHTGQLFTFKLYHHLTN
jgi:hypothetical protein